MSRQTDKKELTLFLVLNFGAAWVLQCAASFFAWQGEATLYQVLLSVSMFAPLAALLLVRRGFGHEATGVRWKAPLRGRIGWWLAAWFGPAAFTLLGAALYFLVFPARLDLTGEYLKLASPLAYQQLTEQGVSPAAAAASSLLNAVTWAPLVNMLFAVGEEAGWRGYLYPRLAERLGSGVKARLLGGVIWGVWHWPIMLLAGYEYGLAYWGAPVLGMALFCLVCICMGILLDLLYEKTGSIWAPALAHGALNAAAGAPMLLLDPAYADQMTLGPTPVGIISLLPMLAAAAAVLARQARRAAA